MKTNFAIIVLFISSFVIAQEYKILKIDSIINSKIEEKDPALFVGIVKDGKIIYEKYRGLANLQHQVKADKNTVSNIASTAKQFTALMILDLALNEKLSLEDDIRKYLPKLYPKIKEKIRIRHLINHTGGIRDYIFLLDIKNKPWWKQVGLDNNDIIDLLEKQEELAFKPGSKYSYSNSGYTILTKIIEKISEKKFYEYSKQFFEELGMNKTAFVNTYMGVIPNKANPYSNWNGIKEFPMVTKVNGDGFLYTTLKDQLIFEQAIQNAKFNNNVLLIKSQKSIPNSEIESYGFGLHLENRFGRVAIHHDGQTLSYHSQTIRFPKEKLSVFVMSNNGSIWSGSIADEVASFLLPTIKNKKEYNSRFYINSDTLKNIQVIRQYRSSKGDLIRIEKKGAKTFWKEGNNINIEIISEGKNTYFAEYNPKLKIIFYENEMVTFYPSGISKTYKKSQELPASFSDVESLVGNYFSKSLDMSFEIKLTEKKELKISFSNREKEREIKILNRNELLVNNFILKIQRDYFDSVTSIFLSLNRAENNRFIKKTNLKYQPKIATENGSIQVTTIGGSNARSSQILLTKNYANGNEIWSKQFGGKSYDKANSIIKTKDGGYLIIGSTSSFGNGNYDVFVIKTDKKGNKIWQNTYGSFYNEYGYNAEETKTGFLIKGTKQNCTSNSAIFNRKCTTNVWFISIDEKGKELSNKVLEEIKN